LARADVAEVWRWALSNWELAAVPHRRSLFVELLAGAVTGESDGQPHA
jgi:hypothetical protein